MANEDSMEVLPSEDNGNVPAEEILPVAPAATPSEVVPSAEEGAEPVVPSAPVEAEMFELPDGRKVDAATLTKEWKENFMPAFTQKSQELANLKTGQAPLTEQPPANPYQDPNYIPQSYEEIIKAAEERTLKALEERQTAQQQAQQQIEDAVVAQITQIRTTDPTLNENALFLHATKYGFQDLTKAHQNMKDMQEQIKKVQTTTAENIAKRQDPVSVTPGNAGGTPLDPSQFATSRDYLRALKGQG